MIIIRCILKSVALLIILSADFQTLYSIDMFDNSKLGISAVYSFDMHSVDLLSIDEIGTCCPKDLDGSGNSSIITIDYGINVLESAYLNFSLGFAFRNSQSNAFENEIINMDSININGVFKHNLNMDYNSIIFKYEYHQDLIGTYGFGASIGYEYLIANNFSYDEVLVSPADRGYFIDTGTRRRNELSGEMGSLSPGILFVGIYFSRELPLDSDFNWIALPKIGFNQVISYVDKNSGWSYNSIFVGVSISKKLMIK